MYRRKIFSIPTSMIVDLVTNQTHITNIPDKSECVAAYNSHESGSVDLIMYNKKFAECQEGVLLERVPVVTERVVKEVED